MDDVLSTGYDGCGRCLVGVRRLSRKPVWLAEPLWDRATHEALVTATAPMRKIYDPGTGHAGPDRGAGSQPAHG